MDGVDDRGVGEHGGELDAPRERDGAGQGRESQGRDVPQRRARPPTQVHQGLRARTRHHHVENSHSQNCSFLCVCPHGGGGISSENFCSITRAFWFTVVNAGGLKGTHIQISMRF